MDLHYMNKHFRIYNNLHTNLYGCRSNEIYYRYNCRSVLGETPILICICGHEYSYTLYVVTNIRICVCGHEIKMVKPNEM